MATKQKKTTYTAAEVAVLEETIQIQKAEIEELKQKLNHMAKLLTTSQKSRFGQSSEKTVYIINEEQVNLFNEVEKEQDHKVSELNEESFTVMAHTQMPSLMKHSLASASSVADIMTKKYADGLSLARQEKILAREGVTLSRSLMANWIIQCSQTWLKPVFKHMKQQLLAQDIIHADQTAVQILKEDGKLSTSESQMWVYASGTRSKTPIQIFDRSGKRPEIFLRGFTGCLVTDGYSGYKQLQKVTHCGCWVHMKQKWHEAMSDNLLGKNNEANTGLQYCDKLFSLEQKCANLKDNYRKEYRQDKILPVLEEYFCWVNTLTPKNESKLAEAVTYAKSQKTALCAFIEHGNVPISNNLAENSLRPFVAGQKSWLFYDTVKDTDSSAIVYSLVETAKANGILPYDYLSHILSVLPTLGKPVSHKKMESLMPWSNEVQNRYGDRSQRKTK